MTANSLIRVKSVVEDCIGQKVKFKVRKGKRRSQINEGIIAGTYPSVFTVHVENRGFKRVMSFNYIDIMTNYVEFFLCNEDETRII
ncbi:Veg family protein [Sedimentibacter sp. MB31-C6]|uniref:Veg family protein n=1 Tax=Sedimentibacter sp. MB31-C6 TaxID=3109366 RepID=UPI002DDD4B15|nr:Veg family protein [Sedimentibacter sp. MB36-C1]WSI03310.1 Veg family protein [Sedimentibacter sp. MB36-C1]